MFTMQTDKLKLATLSQAHNKSNWSRAKAPPPRCSCPLLAPTVVMMQNELNDMDCANSSSSRPDFHASTIDTKRHRRRRRELQRRRQFKCGPYLLTPSAWRMAACTSSRCSTDQTMAGMIASHCVPARRIASPLMTKIIVHLGRIWRRPTTGPLTSADLERISRELHSSRWRV